MADDLLPNPAIKDALLLYRQPVLARKLIHKQLPDGVSDILRIAADGHDRAALFADANGGTVADIHAASLLYLQTVVFHQYAKDARLLALKEPNSLGELRDHKRLIMKWLHPDRNHNSWESKLFHRVQAAAARLENEIKEPKFVTVQRAANQVSAGRLRHSLDNHVNPLPTPGFWRQLLGHKIAATILAMFLLAVGLLVAVEFTAGAYGPNFMSEATN